MTDIVKMTEMPLRTRSKDGSIVNTVIQLFNDFITSTEQSLVLNIPEKAKAFSSYSGLVLAAVMKAMKNSTVIIYLKDHRISNNGIWFEFVKK